MKKVLLLLLFASVIMTGCFSKKTSEAVTATPIFSDSDQAAFKEIFGLFNACNYEDWNFSSTINSNTLEISGTCIQTIIDDYGTPNDTSDDSVVYDVGDNNRVVVTKTSDGKYLFTYTSRRGSEVGLTEEDYYYADGSEEWGHQRYFNSLSDIYTDEKNVFGITDATKVYNQSGIAYVNGSYTTTTLMYCQFYDELSNPVGKVYFIQGVGETMGRAAKTELEGQTAVYFDENGNKVN